MFMINRNLHPSVRYSFQTETSGSTKPMLVSEFLSLPQSKEKLIAVFDASKQVSTHVWSVLKGWNPNAYSDLVCKFVGFIDKQSRISENSGFIDAAIDDEITVMDAVYSWFCDEPVKVSQFSLYLDGTRELVDVDLEGLGSIRRVVLPMNIKRGDMFNVYYGESSKGGAFWEGDLITTLTTFLEKQAA
ncbi:hypothetical protein [Vibrio sp. Hal054]|uniref:hypothetical protein n=1 Tax=Vibrio sp. Hal054 TaxID=3035158 RepID=UPI00301DD097